MKQQDRKGCALMKPIVAFNRDLKIHQKTKCQSENNLNALCMQKVITLVNKNNTCIW